MKWSRRNWGRVCALGVAAVAMPALRAQTAPVAPAAPRPGATRLAIAVDNRTSFCYLPLTIAERLGYFAQEGLDVEVREFPDSAQSLHAVQTGAAHVLSGPYASTIAQQARGQSLQSFVLQGRAPQVVVGVSLETMGHFRGVADLRGRRVGVMATSAASHRVASLVLGKVGLRATDVQYVPLANSAAAVQAFRRGELDAISYTDPTVTHLEQMGALKVVADTRSTRGTAEVFGGPMPSGCLCVPGSFLTQYPRASQALADAMVHALKWLQTAGLSDIIKAVPERHFQGDRALYLAAFTRVREAWTVDGLMPDTGPVTAARMLAQFEEPGSLQRVDLAQTYTNDFARKAKVRFRA
ncbi:ABC transporter substrate-binding protein [Hydrogenophaga laconesensis]|uniref:NitT/TauT family transport system substrate-binding protein n=1 Tax=Hydrogenophaga laconesensis TaxID=1805971 RepID=A0ABU1VF87_9BURK|nr:ABC transporter substrate-binding protein [Hydrogenophaga laconesensis]MDR7096127.1 NitT/TauT family transport system substrate-binding protein [Hydrogenophaga laconesensis]